MPRDRAIHSGRALAVLALASVRAERLPSVAVLEPLRAAAQCPDPAVAALEAAPCRDPAATGRAVAPCRDPVHAQAVAAFLALPGN